MQQSDSTGQLIIAFAKAQAAIEPAKKDAYNPFHKSHYADLGEVWRVVKEAFVPNGLSVIQLPETCPTTGGVTLTTILLHESGEWLSGTMPVKTGKKALKLKDGSEIAVDADGPQDIGSAITYARRYALAGLAGVVAEPDDDGEAAMGRANGAAQKPQVAAQTPSPAPAPKKAPSTVAIEAESTRLLAELQEKGVDVALKDLFATSMSLMAELSGGRVTKLADLDHDQTQTVIARLREEWKSEEA